MNIIKLCSLFLMLILSTGLITTKNDNIPLSKEELKYIFPDDNFRKVVCDHFPNEDITLSKLANFLRYYSKSFAVPIEDDMPRFSRWASTNLW